MTAPKDRTRLQLGVAVVATIGMIVFCALRLRVNNDIMHFLPAGTDHRLADLSRQLADSTLTRTMILDIGVPDREALRGAANAIAAGRAAQSRPTTHRSGLVTASPSQTARGQDSTFDHPCCGPRGRPPDQGSRQTP